MSKRKKTINEIKIKLLPEKSKRDYILRLVSSIIVFVFLIINIVYVYLPYNKYNNQINELRYENSLKEMELSWKNEKYDFLAHDIFHYNDETITDILNSSLNFEKILKPFFDNEVLVTYNDIHDNLTINEQVDPEYNEEIRPFGSKVEKVQYYEKETKIIVYVEFLNKRDPLYYEIMLNKIKYVKNVESSIRFYNDEENKCQGRFEITIDPQNITCPKVEEYK